ncbi:MAG: PucR family transcriptional regulator, partial [Anaerolineae bacterium]
AGRLDHDTTQPHAALIFTWTGKETPSLRRLETAVNWVLNNHSRATLLHIYSDQHICLFQALKDLDDMKSAHTLARRLSEQVSNDNPGNKLIGGLSGPAAALTDWPRIYGEAVQAMQLGQRLHLSHVVDFNSLGVYRLLGQLDDIPAVRSFTRQVIGPLVQYDQDHRSTLVQTLDAYFNHHGNISQTAENLYIHRNTLLYRLERIQELTGHDLNQANMRLALHLALKFWQLQPDSE